MSDSEVKNDKILMVEFWHKGKDLERCVNLNDYAYLLEKYQAIESATDKLTFECINTNFGFTQLDMAIAIRKKFNMKEVSV